MTTFTFSLLAALFVATSAQVINEPTCLYNATHCACRENPTPGSCLRKTSGTDTAATCNVQTCSAGGYACDCLGSHICKIDTCSIWVPKDGTTTSSLAKDSSVDCQKKNDATCLTKVEVPVEYKMVQFGEASSYNTQGNMFNLTAFTDTDDFIASRYKMGDNWDHQESLRYRHITMRLYRSPNSAENMLCAIFNTYGLPSDGLGMMSATSTITGVDGQSLRWAACDDMNECKGRSGNILTAKHRLGFTHTDGWCVKPVEISGGRISVKFSNVNGFEGISFQLSDGSDDAYYFMDGTYGMSGTINENMLVENGDVPEIFFDLAGIEVPQNVVP